MLLGAKYKHDLTGIRWIIEGSLLLDISCRITVGLLQMFAMFNEMFGGMLGAMGGMFFVPGMMDPFADFLDDGKLICCVTSHSSVSDSVVP